MLTLFTSVIIIIALFLAVYFGVLILGALIVLTFAAVKFFVIGLALFLAVAFLLKLINYLF